MKSLYIAIFIFVFLCVITIGSGIYMQDLSSSMLKLCTDLNYENVLIIEKNWNNKKGFLMSLANHKNCEEITRSVIKLKNYTKGGKTPDYEAYAEYDLLKAMLKDIADDEKIKYFNVF